MHSLPFLSTFRYKRLNAYQYTLLQANTASSDIWNNRAHSSSFLQLGLRRQIWQWSSCTGSPTRPVMQHPENPAGFSIQHSQHFHYQAGKAARAWLGATVKDATATASGADTLCPPQSLTGGEKSGSPKFQATSTVLGSFHLTEQHWCLTYTSKQK